MISMKQVTKVYPNGVRALAGLNLEVKQGEFVFIVGPSGAGKSTLMKLLYRAEVPTTGQVQISGVDVTKLSARHLPALRRGSVSSSRTTSCSTSDRSTRTWPSP